MPKKSLGSLIDILLYYYQIIISGKLYTRLFVNRYNNYINQIIILIIIIHRFTTCKYWLILI